MKARITVDAVRKRCDTCHHAVTVSRLQRSCQQLERNKHGFKTGYRCPGKLQRIVRKLRKAPTELPLPPGVGLGHVLSEEYQQRVVAARGQEWRDKAAHELAKAKARHKDAAAKARRAERLMRKWTRTMRELEKRTRMTDAQVEAVRQRAATAAQVSHVKRRLGNAVKQEKQP